MSVVAGVEVVCLNGGAATDAFCHVITCVCLFLCVFVCVYVFVCVCVCMCVCISVLFVCKLVPQLKILPLPLLDRKPV